MSKIANMNNTIIVHGIPSIADDRCLYSLFQNQVKQSVFTGFNAGRTCIVELKDSDLYEAVLKQAYAGAILAQSLNAKKTQRALKKNATEEEKRNKKKKNRKRPATSEDTEDEDESGVNNPDGGMTLLELLQQEMKGGAAASSSSSGAAASTSAFTAPNAINPANYNYLTPEFGPYSNVIINGWRVGIVASPVPVEAFKTFGGVLTVRKDDGTSQEGGAARKRKVSRTETTTTTTAAPTTEGDEGAVAAADEDTAAAEDSAFTQQRPPSSNGRKEVVLQTTRMRAVNQQAPAFGEAKAPTAKITFSDDDDDDVKPAAKKTAAAAVAPVAHQTTRKASVALDSDSDDGKPAKKPASLAAKAAATENSNADGLNNRERKKLAAATKATTSKFKFADSDSD